MLQHRPRGRWASAEAQGKEDVSNSVKFLCRQLRAAHLLPGSTLIRSPGRRGPLSRVVDHISSKLAFFPPQPATYQIAEHKDGSHELYIQPLLQ